MGYYYTLDLNLTEEYNHVLDFVNEFPLVQGMSIESGSYLSHTDCFDACVNFMNSCLLQMSEKYPEMAEQQAMGELNPFLYNTPKTDQELEDEIDLWSENEYAKIYILGPIEEDGNQPVVISGRVFKDYKEESDTIH